MGVIPASRTRGQETRLPRTFPEEDAQPEEDSRPQVALAIGNTGGIGVVLRDQCAAGARLPGFGWGDGQVVGVLADGLGSCAGWRLVEAAGDGATSWVSDEFLVRP